MSEWTTRLSSDALSYLECLLTLIYNYKHSRLHLQSLHRLHALVLLYVRSRVQRIQHYIRQNSLLGLTADAQHGVHHPAELHLNPFSDV